MEVVVCKNVLFTTSINSRAILEQLLIKSAFKNHRRELSGAYLKIKKKISVFDVRGFRRFFDVIYTKMWAISEWKLDCCS